MAFSETGRGYTYYTRNTGKGTYIIRMSNNRQPMQYAIRNANGTTGSWSNFTDFQKASKSLEGATKLGSYGDIVNLGGKRVRINSDGTFTGINGIYGGKRYKDGEEVKTSIVGQKGNYNPLIAGKDYKDGDRVYRGNRTGLFYKTSADGKTMWARTKDNTWQQLTDDEKTQVNRWWWKKGLIGVNTDAKAFNDDYLKTQLLYGKSYLGGDNKTQLNLRGVQYDLNKRTDVLKLQDHLSEMGFYKGPRDGIAGPLTIAGINREGSLIKNKNDANQQKWETDVRAKENQSQVSGSQNTRHTWWESPYLDSDSYQMDWAKWTTPKPEPTEFTYSAPSNKLGGVLKYYKYFR